jgi:hypothetical protein
MNKRLKPIARPEPKCRALRREREARLLMLRRLAALAA